MGMVSVGRRMGFALEAEAKFEMARIWKHQAWLARGTPGVDSIVWADIEIKTKNGLPDTFLSDPNGRRWIEFKNVRAWSPQQFNGHMVQPVDIRPDQVQMANRLSVAGSTVTRYLAPYWLVVTFRDRNDCLLATAEEIVRISKNHEEKVKYAVDTSTCRRYESLEDMAIRYF